ncbi:MAG: hypothetical protein QMD05_05750 [Candidatus Brocadiaceae bacterium]|nr:hypothetical protein [Candidatus Brocadiaceae bacterium]
MSLFYYFIISYALKDESKDLWTLPYLNLLLRSKIELLRIETQYYANDVVGLVTEAHWQVTPSVRTLC